MRLWPDRVHVTFSCYFFDVRAVKPGLKLRNSSDRNAPQKITWNNREIELAPFEKRAAAYLWNRTVFLCPRHRATDGCWITIEPLLMIEEGDRRLGEQILQIVEQSCDNAQPDPDYLGVSRSLRTAIAAATGVERYEAFVHRRPYVGILVVGAEVVFTPGWLIRWDFRSDRPEIRNRQSGIMRSRMIESEIAAMLIAAFGVSTAPWPID
jgi:hypothetical protein